jgi:hypothetical protein
MKTQITSELILASKNAATGDTLFTFRLTYPRIILAENLTHRVASRNTSSTRAIPTIRMIRGVIHDMFVPLYIGSAQKGMQAGEELTGLRRLSAETVWRAAGYFSAGFSYLLYKLGVSKQIAGRIIEPYSWVTQVFSVTDVKNLCLLRNHEAAEPHFGHLASIMQEQIEEAISEFAHMEFHGWAEQGGLEDAGIEKLQILEPGEWHLPFITDDDLEYSLNDLKKMSAARCARTSYTLVGFNKLSTWHEDMATCEKLFGSDPKHLSPCEHQAEALEESVYVGNFRGFKQFRKSIAGENPDSRRLADV